MTVALKSLIRPSLDFPKPGYVYWDTSPLFSSSTEFRNALKQIAAHIEWCNATCIAAVESKGFTLGGALASMLGIPLVLIRKPGLSPGEVHEVQFRKEYGEGTYQLKKNDIKKFDRVYLTYDILAEAGATLAAKKLIEASSAAMVGAGYVVELEYLGARAELGSLPVLSLLQIEDEDRAREISTVSQSSLSRL